ncbi:LOW QUALITY PROTEIN: death domain-associated protein 6-like [Excalfactoria chinensis]|uniref:LOW QUALITY PROTEIN: death domain-associated protein 6-like n=1 Tax=Excalfactoria chinensis TaxID=46218 RepID=UPI003B3A0279
MRTPISPHIPSTSPNLTPYPLLSPLFQFLQLCGSLTEEHPEVLPFLSNRHHKASPILFHQAEFRNVLSRCLNRIRSRPNKIYVYINELCTVLKAHTPKEETQLAPGTAPTSSSSSSSSHPEPGSEPASSRPMGGSKRQISYLENLLRVYTGEIRRLQEKELDLNELDSEDSSYLQESRLKRKMMRIFQRLCELKRCSSLTGRVIEQRIAYRGTRYPEVNRRIERFINRPEVFPDYTDILKVIQKASVRYSLGLTRRQMESMAQDAFREVGNRLQERRHLDLVYNFGSHLTDQYRPGMTPALLDPELAKRLRRNRTVALSRLDAVIQRYAQLQEIGRRTRGTGRGRQEASGLTPGRAAKKRKRKKRRKRKKNPTRRSQRRKRRKKKRKRRKRRRKKKRKEENESDAAQGKEEEEEEKEEKAKSAVKAESEATAQDSSPPDEEEGVEAEG